MPKYSVIISVFNKAPFIKDTLQSVLDQTVQDFEIIVVNDASTDDSEDQIEAFDDVRLHYHAFSTNKGAGASRNYGIKKASGRYIALLDGDDLWKPNYLQEIDSLIDHYPSHSVFATNIAIEEHEGIRHTPYSFENPEHSRTLSLPYFESSMQKPLLTSSSTVLSKAVFEKVGYYDERIKSGQDTDLWVRVGLNYQVAFCTTICAIYRYTPHSLYKAIRTVNHRPDFERYIPLEENHPALKRFLDANRFSLVVRAKRWKEHKKANRFITQIDLRNLNAKQRWLLHQPGWLLRFLFKTKQLLEKLGFHMSVFR